MNRRNCITFPSPRPQLSRRELARAVAGTRSHAGTRREWRTNDTATMDELRARAWNVHRLERAMAFRADRWIDPLCHVLTAGGKRRHRMGWIPILGVLVAVYRDRAAGLLISADEAAATFGCGRRTWIRWVAELEAAGYLERSHTFVGLDGETGRQYERNVYRVGPALRLLARGALLEGRRDLDAAQQARAERYGRGARARARTARRARLAVLYEAQRPRDKRIPRRYPAPAARSSRGSAKLAPQPARFAVRPNGGPGPRDGEHEIAPRLQRPTGAPRSGPPKAPAEPGRSAQPDGPGGGFRGVAESGPPLESREQRQDRGRRARLAAIQAQAFRDLYGRELEPGATRAPPDSG